MDLRPDPRHAMILPGRYHGASEENREIHAHADAEHPGYHAGAMGASPGLHGMAHKPGACTSHESPRPGPGKRTPPIPWRTPARLTLEYTPPGISEPILCRASRFPGARTEAHRNELARLETGLLKHGTARLREQDTRLPEHRFRGILGEKIARGEWVEVKPPERILSAEGRFYTLPRVLALGAPYALEVIAQDGGERFGGLRELLQGKPMKPHPGGRCEPGVYAELAPYLETGTGLSWNHAEALRLLHAGAHPYGWRMFALHPPGKPLCPSWRVRRCGRLCSFHPAAQGMPKPYRRQALQDAGGGELWEVDFKACHPNIALIARGIAPREDPYAEYGSMLRLGRDLVKRMLLPILYGRSREYHVLVHAVRHNSLTVRDAELFYDLVKPLTPDDMDRLLELEAGIMRRVLRRMKAAGMPPGLPVFDSVITPHPGEVERFMLEESEAVLNFSLPVRVSTVRPGLFPG